MNTADLHMHSTVSDGGYSPSELMHKCAEAGYKLVSLTDHDSTSGLKEAEETATSLGLSFLNGIELSTEAAGRSVDILGYGLNIENDMLQHTLTFHRKKRYERMKKMVQKCIDCNLDISMKDVEFFVTGDTYSRPHLAKALVSKGYAEDINEAFKVFVGSGKKCYESKEAEMTPEEAASVIKNAGGIAVVAHPVYYEIDDLIKKWLIDGLIDGIEIYHRDHTFTDIARFETLTAQAENLTGKRFFRTGGTDFHHENFGRRGEEIGMSPLPRSEAARIQDFFFD
ncbi:PHP domain-containing protein [Alkalicoccus daliensis]|uniref:Polymerase/histidinol phosphatase N-terminal domain-containing protein n=1 Tax=Alkalicoccus daliensis TaxID=745820 RepID=A0A1H0AE13_9BACI|nr:PHP domain-containing protein [Alkalicoccus daliensis]SDN31647.1 hypothetical protein SAMN04488053_101446 [Alkalicoccus daliensis]